MSLFGQCGPSVAYSHSIHMEADFTCPPLAHMLGTQLAHAVSLQRIGVEVRLRDPRLIDHSISSCVPEHAQPTIMAGENAETAWSPVRAKAMQHGHGDKVTTRGSKFSKHPLNRVTLRKPRRRVVFESFAQIIAPNGVTTSEILREADRGGKIQCATMSVLDRASCHQAQGNFVTRRSMQQHPMRSIEVRDWASTDSVKKARDDASCRSFCEPSPFCESTSVETHLDDEQYASFPYPLPCRPDSRTP